MSDSTLSWNLFFYYSSNVCDCICISIAVLHPIYYMLWVPIILSCVCVTIDGVWIGEWIYWSLTHDSELQALAVLLLIYTPYKSLHIEASATCTVFSRHCLVTALNSEDSLASVLTSLLSTRYPTTELVAPAVLVIMSWQRPHRRHHSSIGAFVSVATGMCLLSHCPERAVAQTT
jgi:hypothetical protein